jgi:hypothetical protein
MTVNLKSNSDVNYKKTKLRRSCCSLNSSVFKIDSNPILKSKKKKKIQYNKMNMNKNNNNKNDVTVFKVNCNGDTRRVRFNSDEIPRIGVFKSLVASALFPEQFDGKRKRVQLVCNRNGQDVVIWNNKQLMQALDTMGAKNILRLQAVNKQHVNNVNNDDRRRFQQSNDHEQVQDQVNNGRRFQRRFQRTNAEQVNNGRRFQRANEQEQKQVQDQVNNGRRFQRRFQRTNAEQANNGRFQRANNERFQRANNERFQRANNGRFQHGRFQHQRAKCAQHLVLHLSVNC